MLRVLIINFLFSIPFILAQQPGGCPKITGLSIDPYKAAGVWHVYKRSINNYDPAMKCSRLTRTLPNNESKYYEVLETISTITNKTSSVVADGDVNSPTLRHHVPVLGEVKVDNYALGIDYNKYRVMWQCTDHGDTHTEETWVITRDRTPYPELERFIDQSFKNFGLQRPGFSMVDTDCPF